MPVVWFIRHGESESNADLPTIHPTQSALTVKGVAQAQAIAHSFAEKPSLVVVSPYLRTQQTAEPTLIHFASVSYEEWPVQEFTYLDPIHYYQTTGTQRGPFAQAYWQKNDPEHKDGGGSESFRELMARSQKIIDRLRSHPTQFIVVFTHGLFLRALLWRCLVNPEEITSEVMRRFRYFMQGISCPNGCICRAIFAPTGPIYFSGFDTSHLPPNLSHQISKNSID